MKIRGVLAKEVVMTEDDPSKPSKSLWDRAYPHIYWGLYTAFLIVLFIFIVLTVIRVIT